MRKVANVLGGTANGHSNGSARPLPRVTVAYDFGPDIGQLHLPDRLPDILDESFWQIYETCRAYSQALSGFTSVYELYPNIDQLRLPEHFPDIKDEFFWETFEKCKAYSLLGAEAFYNLFRSVEYIATNNVPGDFVECGVFLGGAILAMSDFAHHFGIGDRRFFLYDTFAGFPANTTETDLRGNKVEFIPHRNFLETVENVIWKSLCAREQFHIVQGMVEETLPQNKPEAICLLRLDTDYYESTRVELTELYPRLSRGGVLIVDDYGLFQGARRATDEFLAFQQKKMLLTRINFAVRSGIKP